MAATLTDRAPGRAPRPVLRLDDEYPQHMIHAEGLPYGPVKLWALSTLYLMHHATKPNRANVSLTSDEEHRLRSRLLSGGPGSDLEFQIIGRMTVRSALTQGVPGGVIVPGYVTEFHRGRPPTRMSRFRALDCEWTVFLGDWPDNPLRHARLRADGTWRPLRDTDFEAIVREAQALNLQL